MKLLPAVVLALGMAGGNAMADQPAAAPKPAVVDANGALPPVTVSVGLSTMLNMPWPVKRVSVTEAKIADVQVLTPTQILISGKTVGSTDLILWNKDDQAVRAHVDVEIDRTQIKNELSKMFPKSDLEVRQSRDVVIVSGTMDQADDAAALRRFMEVSGLKYLDNTRISGVQQVQIKVTVAEASRVALRALGINAGYSDGRSFGATNQDLNQFSLIPTPGAVGGQLLAGNSPGANVTLFGQARIGNTALEAFVSALAENQYVRIMAEPTLVALSGQEANFLAGGEFPIPVVQGAGASVNSSSITIEYKEFGVRLRFRPVVLGDGTIRLHVAPEVSTLTNGPGSLQIQGFSVPAILARRADTTLELKSGQTFGMAGLINQTVEARSHRTPGLGDLPVIGSLFRSVRYQAGDTELVVLVTASLVEPMNVSARPTVPGMLHVTPNDWEIYGMGMIEGKGPAKLSATDAQALKNSGLHRLRGPGAWVTPETPAAASNSTLAIEPEKADPIKDEPVAINDAPVTESQINESKQD